MSEYLDTDVLLHAGLIQVLKRGTAEILEQAESGIFLRDRISDVYMLSNLNKEEGKIWLQKHEKRGYKVMQICQDILMEYVQKKYGFKEKLICRQALCKNNPTPYSQRKLDITEAGAEDFLTIRRYYHKLEDEELLHIIKRRELFIGRFEGNEVGFIGQHLEGSMGLLEVFPEYRKQGFGEELERYMIYKVREQGLLPFCQVEVGNDCSMRLQQRLGMIISEKLVYWLY